MEKNKNILELAGSGLVTCQLLADDGRQCVWLGELTANRAQINSFLFE